MFERSRAEVVIICGTALLQHGAGQQHTPLPSGTRPGRGDVFTEPSQQSIQSIEARHGSSKLACPATSTSHTALHSKPPGRSESTQMLVKVLDSPPLSAPAPAVCEIAIRGRSANTKILPRRKASICVRFDGCRAALGAG